jgi:hypothetical protein
MRDRSRKVITKITTCVTRTTGLIPRSWRRPPDAKREGLID